jgi:putative ABC transport system ATP-binding protein
MSEEERTMQKIMIEARGLVRTYRQGKAEPVQALRGADLTLPEGDFAAIVGASGSGKSTLLHILGFMDEPDGGDLSFEGRRVEKLSDGEMTRIRREAIGFVFQTFNLIPSLSAWENVAFPAQFVPGVGARERRERALELLGLVGLAERAGHLPGELSGGQRQRVAIARSLINRPKLLLADEPTGNLDSAAGAKVVELLQRLNAAGQSIVLVTHNPEVAAQAKTLYRMKDGVLRQVRASDFGAAD